MSQEPIPPTWNHRGGRGRLARILLDEVDAGCDPPGPRSRTVFDVPEEELDRIFEGLG